MARQPSKKRDTAAEYRRRNERAIERGYRSYHDERKAKGLSETHLFKRFIREGDMIQCDVRAVQRDKNGNYLLIEKQVFTPFGSRRADRDFRLRNLTRASLIALIEFEESVGVIFAPSQSLDQRALVTAK